MEKHTGTRADKAPKERIVTAITGDDGLGRCPWPGHDPLYRAYHDSEWGVPEYDDRALFEKLILDGFQAGLSWITILRRREGFRAAFAGFEPRRIASFGEADIARLLADEGIIRHGGKINAAVESARAWLRIMEGEGFSNYLWGFLDHRPIVNRHVTTATVPPHTPLSTRIAKDLRARGFNFCGPTIVYAFMQATGMVNDHLVACHRHGQCQPRR
jgi:DNA-3-methyladenine glycosylase I